jgi:26S proteasome regulatory subunit N9
MELIPSEERYVLATDIAMSAITGENIYNFGEVLATPILGYLKATPNQWMCDLVMALHEGSIDSFNVIIDSNREKYSSYPTLVDGLGGLKKKVVLLALINIAFERSANDRQISFADIAARTHIDVDQVEWVIMRAMSLNLVKGSIDQVEQFVNITWVQPRILDKQQLGVVANQLDGWAVRVKETYLSVEDQTSELLA